MGQEVVSSWWDAVPGVASRAEEATHTHTSNHAHTSSHTLSLSPCVYSAHYFLSQDPVKQPINALCGLINLLHHHGDHPMMHGDVQLYTLTAKAHKVWTLACQGNAHCRVLVHVCVCVCAAVCALEIQHWLTCIARVCCLLCV